MDNNERENITDQLLKEVDALLLKGDFISLPKLLSNYEKEDILFVTAYLLTNYYALYRENKELVKAYKLIVRSYEDEKKEERKF